MFPNISNFLLYADVLFPPPTMAYDGPMLRITDKIALEDWELTEQFVRASGPAVQGNTAGVAFRSNAGPCEGDSLNALCAAESNQLQRCLEAPRNRLLR